MCGEIFLKYVVVSGIIFNRHEITRLWLQTWTQDVCFLTRFTTKRQLCLAWFPKFANNFYSPVTQDFSEPENQTEVVSVNLFTIITCTWDFQVLLPYTHSILFSYSLCR